MRYEKPNMEVLLFGIKRSDIVTSSPNTDYEGGITGGEGDGEAGTINF